jgi:hypothetical protein
MVAPSQAPEFELSYGIDLHSLPTTFTTHHVLYLTTLQCLLQLATRPKASNGAVPTIIYPLTRQREGRLLHVSALQPNPSNACQVKSIFESVKASLFGIVSVSYFRSEYTLTTNLSLQPGGMDISLDRTIVLQHCIFILFASSGLRGLFLAFICIKGFRFGLTSRCPFNMYRNHRLLSP